MLIVVTVLYLSYLHCDVFVLEFPQCAMVCSLCSPICSPTDLDGKEEKGKKIKRKEHMYFFPTFVLNTKYTMENTVISTDSKLRPG